MSLLWYLHGADSSSGVSALPHSGRLGDDRRDLIAVAQRVTRIGHDHLSFFEAADDFRVRIRVKSDLNHPRLDSVVAYDLHTRALGAVAHRRTGNRYAAASLGIDRGAGEHSEPQQR